MKKLLLIFCFVGLATAAKPQFIHSLEYKLGTSVSAIDWNVFNTHLYKDNFYGFTTGFNINYLDFSLLNLSSQLSYIQIGGKEKAQFTDVDGNPLGTVTTLHKMNYINFNTLLNVNYPLKSFTPNIKIGPQICYLTSASFYTEEFNRLNYGLNLSAGLDYKLNKYLYLTSDINYIWFFNKIESSKIDVSMTKYASVMLGIGYTFNQKTK